MPLTFPGTAGACRRHPDSAPGAEVRDSPAEVASRVIFTVFGCPTGAWQTASKIPCHGRLDRECCGVREAHARDAHDTYGIFIVSGSRDRGMSNCSEDLGVVRGGGTPSSAPVRHDQRMASRMGLWGCWESGVSRWD